MGGSHDGTGCVMVTERRTLPDTANQLTFTCLVKFVKSEPTQQEPEEAAEAEHTPRSPPPPPPTSLAQLD